MNILQILVCDLFELRQKAALEWGYYHIDTSFGMYYFNDFESVDQLKANILSTITTLEIRPTVGITLELTSDNIHHYEIDDVNKLIHFLFSNGSRMSLSY